MGLHAAHTKEDLYQMSYIFQDITDRRQNHYMSLRMLLGEYILSTVRFKMHGQ